MTNFDGTVDNRWRPDLPSSQRRVREEESDRPVLSRELSFVPARRKAFEAHDAQTTALIRRLRELERLPHGSEINELLSKWSWLDKMHGPDDKQRFLEPLIASVRHDPEANEHRLVFLSRFGVASAKPSLMRAVVWMRPFATSVGLTARRLA